MNTTKDLSMPLYFDIYGEFLTERQSEVFELYYNEDLSLAEIADKYDITRQGVSDALRRARKKLRGMESKLGLVQKKINQAQGEM